MKKLLSLLSVLTISGTAVSTTIAASPYQKEETLNSEINYSEINNLKTLNRNKRKTYNGYQNEINEGVWSLSPAPTKNGMFDCFFTPNFFEEITNLKSTTTKENFSKKFREKFLNESETHVYITDIENIGRVIYDNFWTIANKFIDSSRKNRIKIKIKNQKKLLEDNWIFQNVEIETYNSDYFQNKFVDNLQRDFYVWNSNEEINLGIIEDNTDYEIKNALRKKYPNFELSNVSIVDKKDYSYFTKRFEAKLYMNSNQIYSFGNLRPTLLYITKDKLIEISNIIANDSKVKQWIEHLNDYNKNLPKKIEQLKSYTNNQKWSAKNIEKEIIKNYIRDWNYVLTLIEHELKLNELNKNIQGLKSGIETLKNKINDLDNRVNNLEQPNNCETNGYVVSGAFGIAALAPIPVFQEITAAVSAISGAVAALCGL